MSQLKIVINFKHLPPNTFGNEVPEKEVEKAVIEKTKADNHEKEVVKPKIEAPPEKIPQTSPVKEKTVKPKPKEKGFNKLDALNKKK